MPYNWVTIVPTITMDNGDEVAVEVEPTLNSGIWLDIDNDNDCGGASVILTADQAQQLLMNLTAAILVAQGKADINVLNGN